MEENQEREQYFFEEETMAWIGALISRTPRVAGIFTPSLLRFPNVHVFDADERFEGKDRYTLIDVTRKVPELKQFGMVILDPPFALDWRHLGRLLTASNPRPILISATDWCVSYAGWGDLFRDHRLRQVTTYFPRYGSIGNGYCETTLKRDGRTNISFFSNIPFAPPRRTAILRRQGRWTVFDPYRFDALSECESPPDDEVADRGAQSAAEAAAAKACEIELHWNDLQHVRPNSRLRRLLQRFRRPGPDSAP